MTTAASSQHQEQFFTGTFSSFSVNDIGAAKKFYGETLGVNVSETNEGLRLDFAGGSSVFIYPKDDHAAATFTVLNFKVTDIEKSVSRLKDAGVEFESYDGEIQTDADNIFRGAENGNGPNIAWFKDPAGNFLSIIES